jgi:FMN phosphatase YigB (HAD superfamily)
MMSQERVAILFDVDDTLLDNDRFSQDLAERLASTSAIADPGSAHEGAARLRRGCAQGRPYSGPPAPIAAADRSERKPAWSR